MHKIWQTPNQALARPHWLKTFEHIHLSTICNASTQLPIQSAGTVSTRSAFIGWNAKCMIILIVEGSVFAVVFSGDGVVGRIENGDEKLEDFNARTGERRKGKTTVAIASTQYACRCIRARSISPHIDRFAGTRTMRSSSSSCCAGLRVWEKTLLLAVAFAILLGVLGQEAEAQSDRCTQYNRAGNTCDVQSICNNCVSTSGCMFDLMQRRCENATNSEGVTTRVRYCSGNDTVCGSCSVSSSKPICYGTNGQCICQSLCTIVKPAQSSCIKETPVTTAWLSFGAVAFALPLLLYMQRKWNEPRGVQHMLYNRRQRRLRKKREEQRDTTRDLTLSEWRTHREQHKLDMENIELKSCYLLLQDSKQSVASVPAGASEPAAGTDIENGYSWSTPPVAAVHPSASSCACEVDPTDQTEESKMEDSEGEYEEIAVSVASQEQQDPCDSAAAA